MLSIYFRPHTFWTAWAKFLDPGILIVAFRKRVYPSVTEGDIKGFRMIHRFFTRVLFKHSKPDASGSFMVPGKPLLPFFLAFKGKDGQLFYFCWFLQRHGRFIKSKGIECWI